MASPAHKQAEALADIERIARAFYEAGAKRWGVKTWGWEHERVEVKIHWSNCVRDLLQNDVIRVGKHPEPSEQIPGQTSIDDHSET